jgi:hypothetical protein
MIYLIFDHYIGISTNGNIIFQQYIQYYYCTYYGTYQPLFIYFFIVLAYLWGDLNLLSTSLIYTNITLGFTPYKRFISRLVSPDMLWRSTNSRSYNIYIT